MIGVSEPNKRRVSYIIPPPEGDVPAFDLPPFGTVAADSQSYPLLTKAAPRQPGANGASDPGLGARSPQFQSRNPFLQAVEETPGAASGSAASTPKPRHPQHRLGISCLALDTSTLLSGSDAPGGILYTGGRDGLVASWDLHIPHTKRRGQRYRHVSGSGTGGRVRWERIGDGGADWNDDEDDAEQDQGSFDSGSDDDADDANGTRRKPIPYEDRWEVDHSSIRQKTIPPTTFRQSVQTHTDWVNAMVLCNLNQTVITGSADRTIRAWSPHDDGEPAVPALIGHHTDYVRSLAFARHSGVLFSGALDRDISVWDIANPRPNEPVLKIRLSDINDHGGVGFEGEWGSIYALGVDPAGHTIAAGMPERVVRLWDPRQGDRSVTKLVGHTESVRSILVSDDGRYMLTGSSDTTIKLWSVGEHRCLHTFNHHTSSVWALHSNHPNLERFYSGSRDGYLCVVDVEQCGDMSEGECVVLAREGDPKRPSDSESKTGDEAIRSITSMDDEYVWTATASSDVRRWRDVGRRVGRLDLDFEGSSYPSPPLSAADAIVMGSNTSPTSAASLGAAFEPTSIIDSSQSPLRNKVLAGDGLEAEPLMRSDSRDSRTVAFAPSPVPRPEGNSGSPQLLASSPPNSPPSAALPPSIRERLNPSGLRRTSLTAPPPTEVAPEDLLLNGVPYESLVCLGLPDSPYSFGFAAHSTTSFGSGTRLRGPDDEVSSLIGRVVPPRVAARRAFEERDVVYEAKVLRTHPDHLIEGSPGLIRALVLNDRLHVLTLDTKGQVAVWHLVRGQCLGHFTHEQIAEALELERGVTDPVAAYKEHPQEVLELVQRRIEGKNQVLPWCQVDTKVGQITVHLEGDRVFAAEILCEEVGIDEKDMPDDQKSLNIGKLALANIFRGLIKAEEHEVQSVISSSPTTVSSSLPSISRSSAPTHIPLTKSPRHRTRAMSSSTLSSGGITPSINIAGLATPAERPAIRPEGALLLGQSAPVTSGMFGAGSFVSPSPSLPSGMGSPAHANADPFSFRKLNEHASTPASERSGVSPFSPTIGSPPTSSPAATTPGEKDKEKEKSSGLLGKKKFKGFGKKKSVEPPPTVVESKREAAPAAEEPKMAERDKQQLLFLDAVRAKPFTPPGQYDAPNIAIPPATTLIISEQAHADGAYIVTYRSQVSSTERDMEPLEMNSPFWLINFLFTNHTPEERRPPKISVTLAPEGESSGSTRTLKVQASRTARVRGVMEHLQYVLAAEGQVPAGNRERGMSDASRMSGVPAEPRPAPEDVIELLCGEHVADPRMKVSALKAYYWRGGVDMVLHYRIKLPKV